jgi:hypothetical protein
VTTSSRLDSIRSVYGVSVALNLMKIEVPDSDPSSSVFNMDGLISNSNYVAKKTTMVLFINGMCFFTIVTRSPSPHFMSYFHDQEKAAVLLTFLSHIT